MQVERKVNDGNKLYQTMPENLPSINSQSSVDTPSLSSQSSLDRSENSRDNSETSSPNHQAINRDNDSSVNSTPTHSIGSSSSTDTPVCNPGAFNRNGTLRRVEYFDSLEKNSVGNRSISTDDSWIEKGLNRSLSGPDCLQRHRTDSDTDSVNSLQFREDDNMTMSTDSGLEVFYTANILVHVFFFFQSCIWNRNFSWTVSYCVANRVPPQLDDVQAADGNLVADCGVVVQSTVIFIIVRPVSSRRRMAHRCPYG